ncbi:PRC-barrel domain-containing protein [Flaviaesturariibacter terrae]
MEDKNRKYRLHELGGSKFEIQEGEPDIRGWDVKDVNGRHIGEVKELLFDPESRRVRYLIVDLGDNDLGLDERTVLVPIGLAQLHEVDDDVVLPRATAGQLQALPEYDKHHFGSEHEHHVRHAFLGRPSEERASTESDEDFYNHEHFNEEHLYSARAQRLSETPGSQAQRERTTPLLRERKDDTVDPSTDINPRSNNTDLRV